MRPKLSRTFSQRCFKPLPDDTDPYFGHKSISIAVAKYINENPSMRRRRPYSSESFYRIPLDIYIARIIHECGVPNIVPYAALYLLAAASRTCKCGIPSAGPDSKVSYNVDCEGKSRSPSKFSHRLSELTKNPLKRFIRPIWTPNHFFIGALLVVLLQWHKNYSPDTLSEISGISSEDLSELHGVFTVCINRDTSMALYWMIKESEFRSLNDVECPVVVARRKRLAERKGEENGHKHRSHLGRVFSIKRSRRTSSSSDTSLGSTLSRITFSK